MSADSIAVLLTVKLSDSSGRSAIFGESVVRDKDVLFRPLIPFTRGLAYEVRFKDKLLARFQIPEPLSSEAPRVVSIYPSSDTLPENLLKFYFVFSKPMREGQSLKHVVLLKNRRDTLPQTFLDLQPELWDVEGKWLTLWLDPGRIKRDLQPNQQLGTPLEKGVWYRLAINDLWQDKEGGRLAGSWSKDFFVSARDSQSPAPERWMLVPPGRGTRDPLRIKFNESLDYVLATEGIFITDKQGHVVPGEISLGKKESELKFTPHNLWIKGVYQLQAEVRLEDLAGNNLERLFDREISKEGIKVSGKNYIRTFSVD
jgi:hypothetical protein